VLDQEAAANAKGIALPEKRPSFVQPGFLPIVAHEVHLLSGAGCAVG